MRNKYGAAKTEVDGIIFDSKAEAKHYVHLKAQKEAGEIRDFELQPKFLLRPGFKKDGKTYRAINYVADFKVIGLDGQVHIVDVKGVETEVFKIKRKLFEDVYPELTLTIVKGGDNNGKPKRKRRKTKEETEQSRARKEKSRARRRLRTRV